MRVSPYLCILLCACGGTEPKPKTVEAKKPANLEIADFEINASEVDRFVFCPPPGDIGQDWFPPIPPWEPSTYTAPQPTDGGIIAQSPYLTIDPSVDVPGTPKRTPTEKAIEDTRRAFRACYHRSLVHDPSQNGHVAIVVRVDGTGHVAKVETYGACELSVEALMCMKGEAQNLRFVPPAGGSDTIVIPVVFVPRSGMPSGTSENASYTAASYIAFEAIRPKLHRCEADAKRRTGDIEAWGRFIMHVGARGELVDANVEQWGGNEDLLQCMAHAIEDVKFPPPYGGAGTVHAKISFNPRAGSR